MKSVLRKKGTSLEALLSICGVILRGLQTGHRLAHKFGPQEPKASFEALKSEFQKIQEEELEEGYDRIIKIFALLGYI